MLFVVCDSATQPFMPEFTGVVVGYPAEAVSVWVKGLKKRCGWFRCESRKME